MMQRRRSARPAQLRNPGRSPGHTLPMVARQHLRCAPRESRHPFLHSTVEESGRPRQFHTLKIAGSNPACATIFTNAVSLATVSAARKPSRPCRAGRNRMQGYSRAGRRPNSHRLPSGFHPRPRSRPPARRTARKVRSSLKWSLQRRRDVFHHRPRSLSWGTYGGAARCGRSPIRAVGEHRPSFPTSGQPLHLRLRFQYRALHTPSFRTSGAAPRTARINPARRASPTHVLSTWNAFPSRLRLSILDASSTPPALPNARTAPAPHPSAPTDAHAKVESRGIIIAHAPSPLVPESPLRLRKSAAIWIVTFLLLCNVYQLTPMSVTHLRKYHILELSFDTRYPSQRGPKNRQIAK